ncbi:MAG: DUF308 domain-containing protein [Ruthenibacterium sp.]
MQFAKDYKKSFLLVSLCYLILGAVLLVYPSLSIHTVCYVLGGITAIYGIIQLIAYFVHTDFGEVYRLTFVSAVILIGAGVYVIAQPLVVAKILPLLIGLAIVLDSLIKLQNTIDLKRLGAQTWWVALILSVITAALGSMLLFCPWAKALSFQFIGASLVVDGAVNLFSFSFLSLKLKELRKMMRDRTEANAQASDTEPVAEPTSPAPQTPVYTDPTAPAGTDALPPVSDIFAPKNAAQAPAVDTDAPANKAPDTTK